MTPRFLLPSFVLTNFKNMKTQIENSWGLRSVSFWSVLIISVGIIYIGIRFITDPQTGATGYGIPLKNAGDMAYGQIKGIRDLVSGLLLLPLLWLRMRKAVAFIFTVATIVPAFDFLIILSYNGSSDLTHLLIHGITALVMAITSILLFYGISTPNKN